MMNLSLKAVLFSAFLFVFNSSVSLSNNVSGVVSDTFGCPVSAALITFTSELDTTSYSSLTDNSGYYELSVLTKVGDRPNVFSLEQNVPNPFNPSTTISFSLGTNGHTLLEIYNILGVKIRTIVDTHLSEGRHVVSWDARDERGRAVSSGVYIYRLASGRQTQTRKMLLIDSISPAGSSNQNTGKVVTSAAISYTVTITGETIIPFMQKGIVIDSNSVLDFIVTPVDSTGYHLEIEIEGEGSVTPTPGKHLYRADKIVALEAVPENGWLFSRWEGDVYDSDAPQTAVIMDSDKKVTAVFIELTPPPGNWFDSDWKQRQQIIIENPYSTLVDYPVRLVLDTETFDYLQACSAGEDIRITASDGITPLPYWIEHWDTGGESAIWTKVPYLPLEDTTSVFMYYRNPEALPVSDAGEVFPWYTGFEDTLTAENYMAFGYDGGMRFDEGPVAWYQVINPSSFYVSSQDKTYIVYQTRPEGITRGRKALYFDHVSNTFSQSVDIGGSDTPNIGDAHGNPAMIMDDLGYFYVFYGSHTSRQYYKKSTNPYDVSAWGEEKWIPTFNRYTYPNLLFQDGVLFCFLRRGSLSPGYESSLPLSMNRSFDRGETWEEHVDIADFGEGTAVYSIIKASHESPIPVIHAAFIRATNVRNPLVYMRSADNGESWTKADGTPIALPANDTNADVIYDTGGSAWAAMTDMQFDSNNRPLILFNNNPHMKFTRWTGQEWVTSVVASIDHNLDQGALVLDSDTDYRAYVVQGFGRGGHLVEFRTSDSGNTWTKGRIISRGQVGEVRPVNNSSPDKKLEIIFCGGYEGPTAVAGFGENAPFSTVVGYIDESKWDTTHSNWYASSQHKRSGNYSGHLPVNSAISNGWLAKELTAAKGTVESWWRFGTTSHIFGIKNFWAQNASWCNWVMGGEDGHFKYNIGTGRQNFPVDTVYNTSDWYRITLKFDMSSPLPEERKFWVYINGELKTPDGIVAKSTNGTIGTRIDHWRISSSAGGKADSEMWIDDAHLRQFVHEEPFIVLKQSESIF